MKGNREGDSASNGSRKRRRPGKDARAATLRLIERHAAQVMRTARRYAATVEDAEDAYQRAVEIMLTKAPDVPDAELLPWFKTVVRHEAFALRRKDDRIALGARSRDGDAADEDDFVSLSPGPVEQAERLERLRLGAEALNGLKPQEARALTLLAQGYSYSQICDETGWTYTKVNRCLAEGRQMFVSRVAGIESGAECERLAPRLSAFADGEAPAADVTELRRHLRGCLACQADLRELHLAPAAVGALMPLPLLDRVWWPVDRLAELTTTLRAKLDSLTHLASEWASSPTQFAVAGGARGLVSPGLVKALTIICLGGAGAGGAAAVEEVLDPRGPESAQASPDSKESRPINAAEPASPDTRLMAERLRAPTPPISRDRTKRDVSNRSELEDFPLSTESGTRLPRARARIGPGPQANATARRQASVTPPNASPEGHRDRADNAASSNSAPLCSREGDQEGPAAEPPAQNSQPALAADASDRDGDRLKGPVSREEEYGDGLDATVAREEEYGDGLKGPVSREEEYGDGVGGSSGDDEKCA